MSADLLFIAVIAVALGVGLILLGTMRRNRFGINAGAVACPSCGAEQPVLRKPASLQQALWGGWTCRSCGRQIDKWGRAKGTKPT